MSVAYIPPGMYPFSGGLPPPYDPHGAVYYPWNMPLMYPELRALYHVATPPPNWRDYEGSYYGAGLGSAFEGMNLNPSAKEYVPGKSSSPNHSQRWIQADERSWKRQSGKVGSKGRSRSSNWQTYQQNEAASGRRTSPVNKALENNVKRTIYICDIGQMVTEEQLASLFQDCGHVVDCRVCGDPNSAMRFAFIEFFTEEAAENALQKNGTVLGNYALRVLRSKTAIVPVNNQYLPKTSVERELCSRTIYTANIDRKVDKSDVKHFFETMCGPVNKIRLLGDFHHATRIAFVEFVRAESAMAALRCSGALLGTLPLRIAASKTPVRTSETHSSS